MGERQDLVAGVTTIMDAFITANPTLLKRHFRTRPESAVTDWPCSWMDLRPEQVEWNPAVRERRWQVSIVFVAGGGDNDQQMTLLDELVDEFMDHVSGYLHIIPGSSWDGGTWSEESIPLSDETSAPGVRWTFTPVFSKRGWR